MADTSTLVSALLRRAAVLGAINGRKWIEEEHGQALAAVMAGDEFVSSLSFEGGSQTSQRGINAQELLEACESALQELDGTHESGPILPQFAGIPR